MTVVVPCRNEQQHIGRCLASIVTNDFPKERLEVLVVDGISDDGTRAIVAQYAQAYPSIALIDNPKRITPAALNLGVTKARGDVIVIMGAHSEYPPSYISNCLITLEQTGADVVGGPLVTKAASETIVAAAIAAVTSHPFGVGNSRFRVSSKKGDVDTVPFGAYRRSVFERFGLFDERLLRNQDNEFSSRIRHQGARIYLTPSLTATYFNQASLPGLLRQAFTTGMWHVATIVIKPSAFRLRYFLPMLCVTAFLVLSVGSLFSKAFAAVLLVLLGAYTALALLSTVHIAIRSGPNAALVALPLFFLYHSAYGLGSLAGFTGLVVLPDTKF